MEIALHDPDHGYYHAGNPFGPQGDYLTAADLEAAVRTIAGSARSMGINVEGL